MLKVKRNKLFITTTDTVMGLGGKVNSSIYKQIYNIKKRDKSKKLIIVIANLKQLKRFEKLDKVTLKKIAIYWPGNTTLIINENAYRIPKNKKLLKFIRINGPFYLTSANISNHSTISNIEDVNLVFPRIKFFNFGLGNGTPSQIINIKTNERIR